MSCQVFTHACLRIVVAHAFFLVISTINKLICFISEHFLFCSFCWYQFGLRLLNLVALQMSILLKYSNTFRFFLQQSFPSALRVLDYSCTYEFATFVYFVHVYRFDCVNVRTMPVCLVSHLSVDCCSCCLITYDAVFLQMSV